MILLNVQLAKLVIYTTESELSLRKKCPVMSVACLSFFTGHFFFTGHYWTLLTVESRGTLKQNSATVRVFSEYFI